jgi:hypothetical protein
MLWSTEIFSGGFRHYTFLLYVASLHLWTILSEALHPPAASHFFTFSTWLIGITFKVAPQLCLIQFPMQPSLGLPF